MRLVTLKFLIVTVVASALMLAGAGVASATSETTEAGGLRITASLEPSTVSAGDLLSAYYDIENVSGEKKCVQACLSLSKDGVQQLSNCRNLVLQPGRSADTSSTFLVSALAPGTYTLTISAGLASASASVTVIG